MYQRILVPIDGSATSDQGLAQAVALARLSGGEIRLLHVVDDLSVSLAMSAYGGSAELLPALRDNGALLLGQAAETVRAAGVPVSTQLVDDLVGPVRDHIARAQRDWGAEIIVMGTHGRRGVGRMLLGSSAEQVVRGADVPVLLVRAPETAAPQAADHSAPRTVHVSQPTAALRAEKS